MSEQRVTTTPGQVSSKPPTPCTFQVTATPAMPLNQEQMKAWFCSREIMAQMQTALDTISQGDMMLAAEMQQTVAACNKMIPPCDQELQGTTIHDPLPSTCIGKLLPCTRTPDIHASNSITGQSGVTREREVECTASLAKRVKTEHPQIWLHSNHTNTPDIEGTDTSDTSSHGKTTKKTPSKYRGVTQHKRSGRFEAHVWVNSLKKQVYLGGYSTEELAAEAYDIVLCHMKGIKAKTNFPVENYAEAMCALQDFSIEEVISSVKREADSFSRGASKYRGVTKAATDSSAFESRIGVIDRHIYLGLFNSDVEAARAYDRALIRVKGSTSTTNFNTSEYAGAMEDHRVFQMLVSQGHEHVTKMMESNGERYAKMFEEYVRGGMNALPPEVL